MHVADFSNPIVQNRNFLARLIRKALQIVQNGGPYFFRDRQTATPSSSRCSLIVFQPRDFLILTFTYQSR